MSFAVTAQVAADTSVVSRSDTILPPDSAGEKRDSLNISVKNDSVSKRPTDTLWKSVDNLPLKEQVLQRHPYFKFNVKPVVIRSEKKLFKGKETLFYAIIVLLTVFGLLKLVFAKYFSDLLRVFFRTTLKQRQI